jgi:hypothetical protein
MFPGNPHALRLREREAAVRHAQLMVANCRGILATATNADVRDRAEAAISAKLSQLAEAERLVAVTRENLARQETP